MTRQDPGPALRLVPGEDPRPDPPSVRSEVGELAAVLVHRPGEELRRVTPSTMEQLLFDELLWVEQAQAEHDAFTDLLRAQGVEVLTLTDLLAEVVAEPEAARALVDRHVTATTCGPQALPAVRERVLAASPQGLVGHLIAGITHDEVGAIDGLVAAVAEPGDPLFAPVPNLVFTRDASAWVGEGVVLSPMHRSARRRETDLLRTLYREHPRFDRAPVWFGGQLIDRHPATFEGGDVLVVGERGLAIGLSERTSPAGVETLAARLFAAGVVDRVLAVELPKVRAAMHLDTVVTQVDVDAFITYPQMTRRSRTFQLTPRGRERVHVDSGPSLVEGLAWAAGLDHARVIEPDLSAIRAEREQWNDANNTLALRPGEVIAYERNVATNEILEAAGITVHTIPSNELPRGRGGPRCMSCPVIRRPLP